MSFVVGPGQRLHHGWLWFWRHGATRMLRGTELCLVQNGENPESAWSPRGRSPRALTSLFALASRPPSRRRHDLRHPPEHSHFSTGLQGLWLQDGTQEVRVHPCQTTDGHILIDTVMQPSTPRLTGPQPGLFNLPNWSTLPWRALLSLLSRPLSPHSSCKENATNEVASMCHPAERCRYSVLEPPAPHAFCLWRLGFLHRSPSQWEVL